MKYDAVIFDFDGVLMDSGFDGFQWALEERRKTVEQNGWDVQLNKLEQGIFQPHHSEDIKERMEKEGVNWEQLRLMEKSVAERKVEMASNGDIELFRDVEEVLEKIDAPVAVVGNAYKNYLDLLLSELGIN
jgi:Predicted phosphatases